MKRINIYCVDKHIKKKDQRKYNEASYITIHNCTIEVNIDHLIIYNTKNLQT